MWVRAARHCPRSIKVNGAETSEAIRRAVGTPGPPPTHSPLPAHPQMPEEEAFCVFVRLMQEYRLRELFKPSMAELGLCIYQFEYMLQVSGPRGGPACPPTSSSPHIRVLTSAVPVSLFD